MRASQANPSDAVGRAKQARLYSGRLVDGVLSSGELIVNKLRGMKMQAWVSIGVIADLVPGGGHLSRDFGAAAHIFAAHEKGCRDMMLVEKFEQRRSGFAGPIVESKGDGGARRIAVMYRGSEHG